MTLERHNYTTIGRAALIVTIAMIGLMGLSRLASHAPVSGTQQSGLNLILSSLAPYVRTTSGILLLFPGVLLFMPFILQKFHDAWDGYFVLGIALNWLLYVWAATTFIDARRRKR